MSVIRDALDVAAGLDAVWVADRDGRLLKINEANSTKVDEVSVDGSVVSVAVDDDAGYVWIRTFGQRKIYR
jgi:hypothetical protein